MPVSDPEVTPLGDFAAELVRAELEALEIGHRFVVIAGAIDHSLDALAAEEVTVRIAGAEHQVAGFFAAATPDSPRAAFRTDIPRPPGDLREAAVELAIGGRTILSRPVSEIGYRSFMPSAKFERVDPGSVSGWVFDPGLWHGDDAEGLELAVGRYRVPIKLSVERPDLPYSAAGTGRPIGFDVAIATELGAHTGRQLLADLRSMREVRVTLYSLGLNVASARLELEGGTPAPPAPVSAPLAVIAPAPAAKAAPAPAPLKGQAKAPAAVPAKAAAQPKARLSPESIELHIDESLLIPGAGIVVMGWMADPRKSVQALRVRSGRHVSAPLQERWFPIDRADVAGTVGRKLGIETLSLGFHAFAPLPVIPEAVTLEVELTDGSVSQKPLSLVRRNGRDAVMRMLSDVKLTTGAAARLCTEVFGPPVKAIGEASAAATPGMEFVEGELPTAPRCSMIVPLYGRLDFLHYQAAIASEHDEGIDEYVYVLDEPHRKEEFLALARRVHVQIGMPFRLLVLPHNHGFAGASNAGLAAARGNYVCFLNSDVMPTTPGWAGRLIAALEADPGIGLIGPRLLFEDGTVQHAGMELQNMPEMGGLAFPRHPGKGRLPGAGTSVRRVPLITGACMVMRRELAEQCGGFSTEYVIGDFEDADLCMKAAELGFDCAVHDGVDLYHLERQSQGASANRWRHNLTLINAWVFANKWKPEVQ